MNSSTTYRAAVFLSAFLLFMVEPMISKSILPIFGGSFMVWGACMVFFQAVLLAGYVYAHVVSRLWGNAYARWHWILLLTSLLMPLAGWGAARNGSQSLHPFLGVLMLLTQSVGWPAFLLSATSPLLQRWFSDTDLPGKDNPYALFATSNAGSLVGLLGYPVVMEPLLDLSHQFQLWWVAIGSLAMLQFACGRLVTPRNRIGFKQETTGQTEGQSTPLSPLPSVQKTNMPRLSWFLLGAAPCALFMATTNVITMDIASVPLLWVLPLAAYLVAFIFAFKNRPWRPAELPRVFPWVALIAMLLCILSQMHFSLLPIPFVIVHLLLLLVACWVCALRLADLKPENHTSLTAYYLLMGFGGLAGGAGVAWIAPLVSTELAEFPFSYALTALALAIATKMPAADTLAHNTNVDDHNVAKNLEKPIAPRGGAPTVSKRRQPADAAIVAWIGCIGIGLLLVPWLLAARMGAGWMPPAVGIILIAVPVAFALRAVAGTPTRLTLLLTLTALLLPWTERIAEGVHHATRLRNFYGIYRVFDKDGQRILQHGSTQHGRQYLTGPESQIPAGYYHPSAPPGELMQAFGPQLKSIGMIGLGTGAMPWYGQNGTRFKIFELDPDGVKIAENEFTYLYMARRKGVLISFVLGDGRVSLRQEAASSFDLLLVDAFNSGSIPTHLLTVEAFKEYLRVIQPNGLLLLHVSNRNLDLQPVVAANAMHLGLRVASKSNAGSVEPGAATSEWMVVARQDSSLLNELETRLAWQEWKDAANLPRPWTDSYSNILGAFSKW